MKAERDQTPSPGPSSRRSVQPRMSNSTMSIVLRPVVSALLMLAMLGTWSGEVRAEEAAGRPPVHVQIVLDSSGSMKQNDPRRLSSLAGMIFTDLAGPDDWVGVLSMRKGEFVEERITQIEGRRERARESVRGLPFRGSTYCAEPLQQAAAGLADLRKRDPTARQFVIFLSDGECPPDSAAIVREAARELGDDDVRIFSIGLFEDDALAEGDPTRDLRTMASVSDGEFFRVKKAADLPEGFAAILGRIVGSEAQKIALEPGGDVTAELDGYAYDASFIATGSGKPVVIDQAQGPGESAIDLPRRTRHAGVGERFYAAAFDNGAGRHYSVLRIDEPPAGTWTFRVDGPSDLKGLLIQNYALDPVVELEDLRDVYAVGQEVTPVAWLRGKGGDRIDDQAFLEKVEFTVYLTDPKGKQRTMTLEPTKDGTFRGKATLQHPGEYVVRGRARMRSGGLDKRTETFTFAAVQPKLVFADAQEAIDFGSVKAGRSTDSFSLDFSGSELPHAVGVRLRLDGLERVAVDPNELELASDATQSEVSFEIGADHPGGAVHGTLVVDGVGQPLRRDVKGEVVPLTFWELWGRLVTAIGIGLLGLLLLIFIVYGFVKGHSFSSDARINWGDSLDRLDKNEIVIRELRGTGKGFYRNAKLVIGGANSPLAIGGVELAEIEATGASQTTLTAASGAELRKINKFDDSRSKTVDGNTTAMHQGEIYQIGEIYLRLQ